MPVQHMPTPEVPPPHSSADFTAGKAFRAAVWQDTFQCYSAGGYVSSDAVYHRLDAVAAAAGVQRYDTTADFDLATAIATAPGAGRVHVLNQDCLDAAEALATAAMKAPAAAYPPVVPPPGFPHPSQVPLVLDAASRGHFGGGYAGGARAQEEEMCRRTTLALAMHSKNGVQTRKDFYPLPPQSAIYVPHVTAFRHGPGDHYRRMAAPFTVAFGIVAAYRQPPLDSAGRLTGVELQDTQAMIRNFFATAIRNGHRSVVVVPPGCGAFRNPARHIAELCANVLVSEGFLKAFDDVTFSILDDHNAYHEANPDGNFTPFAELFTRVVPGTRVERNSTAQDYQEKQRVKMAEARGHHQKKKRLQS